MTTPILRKAAVMLRDQRALRHALGLGLLIGGFCVAHLHAQGMPHVDPTALGGGSSLLDRWLSPDVVIGGVLVLLYAGELRGDLTRIKAEQKEFREFRQTLHEKIAQDYMSRETLEARLAPLEEAHRETRR